MAEDTCVMVLGTSAEIACHVSRNAGVWRGGRALSQVIEVVTVETFGIVEELFLLNCSTRKLEGNKKKKRTQVTQYTEIEVRSQIGRRLTTA